MVESIHEANMILDAAARLEPPGNPMRLKIYRALVCAGEAGLAVGKLQQRLEIAPSTLSHHIKSPVVTGLITQVREATTLVCHANFLTMRDLLPAFLSRGVAPNRRIQGRHPGSRETAMSAQAGQS
jgi:DNA-binding transcriptional ArsR family regulator